MINIKQISARETIPVRQPVLRAGRPESDCIFEGDNLPTTVHYAIFVEENLVGVATFLENSKDILTGKQMQLRGMAVLDAYQGKGFGKLLLEKGEILAHEKKTDILWFHARINAKSFYEKQGYMVIGEPFEIPQVGTHYVMYKELR